MKRFAVAALTFALLAVPACGGDSKDLEIPSDESSATEKAATGGPGIYEFEHFGATGSINLTDTDDNTTELGDPDVAAMEKFRKKVKADPVYYVLADVDNKNGEDHLGFPSGLTITSEEGETFESADITLLIEEWSGGGDLEDIDNPNYEEGRSIIENLQANDIAKGAVGTALFVFQQPISSIGRVTLSPDGITDVEATKVE